VRTEIDFTLQKQSILGESPLDPNLMLAASKDSKFVWVFAQPGPKSSIVAEKLSTTLEVLESVCLEDKYEMQEMLKISHKELTILQYSLYPMKRNALKDFGENREVSARCSEQVLVRRSDVLYHDDPSINPCRVLIYTRELAPCTLKLPGAESLNSQVHLVDINGNLNSRMYWVGFKEEGRLSTYSFLDILAGIGYIRKAYLYSSQKNMNKEIKVIKQELK